MKINTIIILSLVSFLIPTVQAAPPAAVESAVSTSQASSEAGLENDTEPWTNVISPEGPVGIAKMGKNVTHCGDVRLETGSSKLTSVPGKGVVAAVSKYSFGDANNVRSKQKFGDCEVQLEFLIGKGSNSGVKLQSRYEIQIYDSHHKEKPTARECGGVYPHWVFQGAGRPLKYIDKGVPPSQNAAKPAGEWQTMKIIFKAPRFNEKGKKVENARFVSVHLNDKEIHADVEVDSPTGNASTPLPEVATAPLFLQLDHGAVAFRNVKVKRLAL